MEVEGRDGPGVALVHVVWVQPGFRPRPIVPVRLVHHAFLRAHPKRRRLVVREVKRGDAHFVGLVVRRVDEVQRFLYVSYH